MATTGIEIDNAKWNEFKTFIEANYPKPSFTHENRDFVNKALLQGPNKTCPDVNRLWVSVFCGHLCNAVGDQGLPSEETSLVHKTEFLNVITSKAILGFFDSQNELRLRVSHNMRSPEQIHMLNVHPNIVNFPLDLSLDMGRLLELPAKPTASSPSELVETQQLFHTLHRQILHQLAVANREEGGAGEKGEKAAEGAVERALESEAAAEEAHEWSGHSVDHRFLRLCVFKVWAHKYEQEEEWAPSKMCDEWLREGVALYNTVSYHWPQCVTKRFPTEGALFQAMRKTACNLWLPHISQQGVATHADKPSTPWITDWSVSPSAEKRRAWENYYCAVACRAKNMARLLHAKRDVVHLEEPSAVTAAAAGGEGEGAAKRKRAKRGGSGEKSKESGGFVEEIDELGPQFDHKSTEFKIQQIVRYEVGKLEKKVAQMQRDAEEYHSNSLRELAGHFSPVTMQLNQLSRGQGFLYNMIDNLSKNNK